jgi:predicted Co/Zn/Cd cation transporter (cation efflux family)
MKQRILKTLAVIILVTIILSIVGLHFGWSCVINMILVFPFVIGAAVLGLMLLSLLIFVIKGEF